MEEPSFHTSCYQRMRPYAFRTFVPWNNLWTGGVSSAEWPEGVALELGDRVSEHWFFEKMYEAYALESWVGQP